MSVFEKLKKSARIMREVAHDRGYIVPNDVQEPETDIMDDFRLSFWKGENETGDRIMIFWKETLGTNVREIVSILQDQECNRAIIISKAPKNHWAKTIIDNMRKKNTYIDVYLLDEAQINITKHKYVPKHEICTTREKNAIMKSYSATSKQLPEILQSDPIMRHYGGRKGQLIRITRTSETLGKPCVTFRIVA